MPPKPKSLEYRALVGISKSLQAEYHRENNLWKDSPFAWIKLRPSRSVGAIGEAMVAAWMVMHGFGVQRSPDSQADRIIEGKRVEIKFSTLWKNGAYCFQQIRDQNYDFMVMLGISPHDAHCWVIPKADLMTLRENGALTGQHTGHGAKETTWVQLRPDNTNPHFAPYGNGLDQTLKSISALTGFKSKPLSSQFDS